MVLFLNKQTWIRRMFVRKNFFASMLMSKRGRGGKICYNFYLQRERSWFHHQGYVTTIGKIIYIYIYITRALFILCHRVLRLSGKGGKIRLKYTTVGNNASDGAWFLCLPIRGVQTGSAPVIRGFACLACKCYTVWRKSPIFNSGHNNSGLDKIEELWEITGSPGTCDKLLTLR